MIDRYIVVGRPRGRRLIITNGFRVEAGDCSLHDIFTCR